MRVFLAGASGAIGSRLVPQLLDRGHEVVGTHRSPGHAERVRALGAQPIRLDLLDASAVREAVLAAEPEAIVHQATALGDVKFSRNMDRSFTQTNRLRTEGTDALLAAAREVGVRRFVAQSFASMRRRARAGWSRPRTIRSIPTRCRLPASHTPRCGISTRRSPMRAGSSCGTASSTAPPTTERGLPGIYNIVDDEPAPVREWLPVLAQALGAKPPRHVPRWLARLVAGDVAVMMGTESRAASNAKARRELGWEPRYASWRQGFAAAYALQPAEPPRDLEIPFGRGLDQVG